MPHRPSWQAAVKAVGKALRALQVVEDSRVGHVEKTLVASTSVPPGNSLNGEIAFTVSMHRQYCLLSFTYAPSFHESNTLLDACFLPTSLCQTAGFVRGRQEAFVCRLHHFSLVQSRTCPRAERRSTDEHHPGGTVCLHPRLLWVARVVQPTLDEIARRSSMCAAEPFVARPLVPP